MNGPLFNPYGKSIEILGTVYQPAADRNILFVLLVVLVLLEFDLVYCYLFHLHTENLLSNILLILFQNIHICLLMTCR